ncbi:L,D-transpeptidase family protein [Parasalinivibrio latis]|uniref:L,D-transpeptidase family protein n=1 Tax=Parasalinivibrio latis TaxID=2952610 RepID=UPI0030DFC504
MQSIKKLVRYIVVAGAFASASLHAATYKIPEDGSRIVGRPQVHQVLKGEHLEKIAKSYDVGFLALMAANRGVDPYLPDPGTFVDLPTEIILPDVKYDGIVINLAELRLYFFELEKGVVHIFPIGIGRIGRETPAMETYISQKREHPTWTPPASIRKEYLEKKNIVLPEVVPAGPNNPLGDYAMRLAFGHGDYLIHGTNKSFGVGMRVSSGCIRMRPSDIEWLFQQVPLKEKVRVINEPVKYSFEPDGSLYVEVHRPLSQNEEQTHERLLTAPDEKLTSWLEQNDINRARYSAALAVQSGLPTEVGVVPEVAKE